MTETDAARQSSTRRPGSIVFGIVVGLLVALASYQWITDPGRRETRAAQERIVYEARGHLRRKIGRDDVEIVDPLAPERKVGKVFVYAADGGYEVSGYYRRDASDRWHPFLATLAADGTLTHLKVQDDAAALGARAQVDSTFSVID